jgi:hypothetical protein
MHKYNAPYNNQTGKKIWKEIFWKKNSLNIYSQILDTLSLHNSLKLPPRTKFEIHLNLIKEEW